MKEEEEERDGEALSELEEEGPAGVTLVTRPESRPGTESAAGAELTRLSRKSRGVDRYSRTV